MGVRHNRYYEILPLLEYWEFVEGIVRKNYINRDAKANDIAKMFKLPVELAIEIVDDIMR